MKAIIFLFILILVTSAFAQKTEDNKTSKQTSQKSADRVIFIGDSITDFWDNEGFGFFFSEKSYINRGISGQNTPQMLARFQQDVIDLKPKAVVILGGTNDIYSGSITLEQTSANIASMAEQAKANGIKVIISSVLPVSDTVPRENGSFFINTDLRPLNKILAMNKWLKSYALQNGHVYLDYFSVMADKKGFIKDGLTMDGLHPNAKGYAIMNPLAEKAIKRALKIKK